MSQNMEFPTYDDEYRNWIQNVILRFKESQIKAAVKINSELLRFYWSLGEDIITKETERKWGDGFLRNLSRDLHRAYPDIKGFSETNLKYIKYFYSTYNQNFIIRPQLGDELRESLFNIPWGHHKVILDKYKSDPEKAFFFVQKTIENSWSRAMLSAFIGTDLYERSGKAITNFKNTLPASEGDVAQEILKDPYNFDFLALRENYKEKDLQLALERNISRFLLELGNGFAYVGRQVRLEVDGDEFFCDLLFYHIRLKRFVVCELKVTKFEPEYVSKLNFYCTAVNHLIKGSEDNDTIGLLICKEKNDLVAKWTVENNQQQPLGISSFELTKLYPRDLEDSLPSIEEIENELNYTKK